MIMSNKEFSRRQFIQTIMAGVALGPAMMGMQRINPGGIPTRPLGKTGENVSIISLGGWDSVANKSDEESIQMMHEALEGGVTFWDNSWDYHQGRAEEVMGKALAQGNRRDKVFLMTKVCARDYAGVKRQLEESLRRLRTDRIDLWQFHAIQYEGDMQRIFDPENGGLRAAIEARKEGKVRYIGFTGHRHPDIHLEMMNQNFEWDSVQMPLNIMDAHYNSFQNKVLTLANARNTGTIGMKTLASQNARIPRELNISPELCIRYSLSLPVSSVCLGIQTRDQLVTDLKIARNFKPLTEDEANRLLDQSKVKAMGGEIELYKDPASYFGCGYHARVLEEEKKNI
jgi:uncharacterized protein